MKRVLVMVLMYYSASYSMQLPENTLLQIEKWNKLMVTAPDFVYEYAQRLTGNVENLMRKLTLLCAFAERDHAPSLTLLGRMYIIKLDSEDKAKGLKWLTRAAELQHLPAVCALSRHHFKENRIQEGFSYLLKTATSAKTFSISRTGNWWDGKPVIVWDPEVVDLWNDVREGKYGNEVKTMLMRWENIGVANGSKA